MSCSRQLLGDLAFLFFPRCIAWGGVDLPSVGWTELVSCTTIRQKVGLSGAGHFLTSGWSENDQLENGWLWSSETTRNRKTEAEKCDKMILSIRQRPTPSSRTVGKVDTFGRVTKYVTSCLALHGWRGRSWS